MTLKAFEDIIIKLSKGGSNQVLLPKKIPNEIRNLIEDPMTWEDYLKFEKSLDNYPGVKCDPDNVVSRFYFNDYHHPLNYSIHLNKLKRSAEDEIKSLLFSDISKREKLLSIIEIKNRLYDRHNYFKEVKDENSQNYYIRTDIKDIIDDFSLSYDKSSHLKKIVRFIKYEKKTIDDLLFFINEISEFVKENDADYLKSYTETQLKIQWEATDTDLLAWHNV